MKKYIILGANDTGVLADSINKYLSEGADLVGGVAADESGWYQALLIPEEVLEKEGSQE